MCLPQTVFFRIRKDPSQDVVHCLLELVKSKKDTKKEQEQNTDGFHTRNTDLSISINTGKEDDTAKKQGLENKKGTYLEIICDRVFKQAFPVFHAKQVPEHLGKIVSVCPE